MQSANPAVLIEGQTKVQGKFRLSIPTSLALETIFNVNENVSPVDPPPWTLYRYLVINVRTLIRNIHSAVAKELKTTWTTDHYWRELLEELQVIPEVLEQYAKAKLQVVYYVPTYKTLVKHYPHANLKVLKGPAAIQYQHIEDTLTNRLIGYARSNDINLMVSDVEVPLPKERCLILTHYPVDLIPYAQTSRCDLLESHTGVIKSSTMWYTKLNGPSDAFKRIPFGRFSIQVFGDSRMFSALPSKYKATVMELAESDRWNQLTKDSRIKTRLSKISDPVVREDLKKLV